MWKFAPTVLIVCFLASMSPAQTASDNAIRDTIQSQIDAFLRDDFDAAFGFASPSIRQMFRTPENFGAMVRNGYPMVWRPDDVRFGPLEERGGALWQRVFVADQQGKTHVLDYRMEQRDGEWRIAAVILRPAPELNA